MIYAQVHLTLPAWASTDIDPLVRFDNDEARMRFVAGLARKNVELGTGGPFGAAIFDGDGRLVSIGVNRVMPQNCSLAHAEIMAFLTAQQRLQRFRLNEDGKRYVLVTSAQPCCQCYGASFWAGIDEMQIGAGRFLNAVGQLKGGGQRNARQVATVFTVGTHGGNFVGLATPQNDLVSATEGEGEGGAPRSRTENGNAHDATAPRPD